jgi:hypothetical protein
MLLKETVASPVLELLKSLQQQAYLRHFYLAGGTALALYYGHRKSVDIDLFSNFNFNAEDLLEQIQQDFQYELFNTAKNTLKGRIKKVSVDIIAHRYPYIRNPQTIQDISLLAEPDLLAMKLNAISVSGQRSKDFIDIYYGLEKNSISEMIRFYKEKYHQSNSAHVLKSLIYFEEVDLADWPVIVRNPQLNWETVKDKIEKAVMQYIMREDKQGRQPTRDSSEEFYGRIEAD